MRPALSWLLLAVVGAAPAVVAAEYRLQAAHSWVDNLSRTSAVPDQRAANVLALDASALQVRQLARDWTALGALEAGVEHVPDWRGLDRWSVGARGTIRRKFGLGPFAPVLDAAVGLTRLDFREAGRSGWRGEGALTLSKRLTESWRVAGSASWESTAARREPFDNHGRRLALEATWDVAPRARLAAGAARYTGDIVANAAGGVWAQALADGFGPRIGAYYRSTAWEVTDTFGPGWVAYRVQADADFLWAEASLLLGDRTRAALRLETVKVVNVVDIRYDTEIWSLTLAHRF